MQSTPTPHELRVLLPDIALMTDKLEIMRQLRPLQLDIDPCDPDFKFCIQLHNGYALVFTAGDLSHARNDSWVRGLPVSKLISTDLDVLASRQAHGEPFQQIVTVPVFTAYVRLTHRDQRTEVPSTHYFVESPSAVALIENALLWSRKLTGLPLQWQHKSFDDEAGAAPCS